MKNKRILFLGGKYVGYNCLNFLLQEGYNVIGCLGNIDEKLDNKWYPSVFELCQRYKLPFFIYPNVNSSDVHKQIKKMAPELIIVVYYDQILKKNTISIPQMGCLNLHLALVQYHRGCYPTTWSLIRGDKYTGATLHYITEKIDGGPIVAQKRIEIMNGWTGKDLYYQVSDTGIALFKKIFPKIDKIKPRKINLSKVPYYKKIFPSLEVSLDKKTYNYIRALVFEPFPPPYIKIGKRVFTIEERKRN